MDKRPVYPGAIPLDLDWLQPQRNTEIALGFIMQAAFGTNTAIDGLTVTQTASPSMAVLVGPGSVIFTTTVDTVNSGFGSLTKDTTDPLVKIGINLTSTTMATLTAPGTAGQSQNWLVEAQFLEQDGSPVVLPYYDAANPAVPYTGPANAGTTNNTARTNTVQLQWKAGTAAATGSQNTPTPDAGWVGVAIVTVANGQASITNSNITPYSLAPTVPTKLLAQRTRLKGNLNLYVSATGSDSANSGLSAASPFASMQKAWNYMFTQLDLNNFGVTINVADGSYTTGVLATGMPPGYGPNSFVSFVGDTTTPASCTVTTSNAHCFFAALDSYFNVAGFQMSASGTVSGNGAGCLVASVGSSITVNGKCTFGAVAATGAHMWANSGSQINLSSISYTITGGGNAHMNATLGGIVNSGSCTVTLSGTMTFNTAFAYGALLGVIQSLSSTYTGGTITGLRYSATYNSVINTNGGGATLFPGGTAGSTSSGGQYA